MALRFEKIGQAPRMKALPKPTGPVPKKYQQWRVGDKPAPSAESLGFGRNMKNGKQISTGMLTAGRPMAMERNYAYITAPKALPPHIRAAYGE